MTVSSTQCYVDYNADGVTKTFTIPFYFLLNGDISAMVSDASGNISELVNGTDFNVSGAGNIGGGAITFVAASSIGSTILIYRNPPVTQETKYYENGKFPATSHEAALDKLTMLIQDYGWRFDSLALKKPSIFSSFYDAKNLRISSLADPVSGADAATKTYADAIDSGNKTYTDEQIAKEALLRETADRLETQARSEADANIQEQLTGIVPLEASAFSEISWHGQQIKNSVIIPENKNAWSFGPQMEISSGQQVTISEGSSWTIADGRQVEDEDLHNLTADTLRTSDGSVTVLVDDIATNTDLSALTSRVGMAESDINQLQSGLSTANSSISDKAAKGTNSDITSLTGLTTPLSRSQGGTGQVNVTYVQAYDSTSISIPTGSFTRINPAEVTDTSNSYNSGTFTANSDGYYHLNGKARVGPSTTANSKVFLKFDSSSSPSASAVPAQTSGYNLNSEVIIECNVIIYLAANSTISLYIFHNDSSSLSVSQKSLTALRVA